ncbi:hypothetical protein LV457_09530 [Mycobacterium sp. MYCO198283]|uniref:hypothetical protein n=1 Tax=Mycobacterium sp. MYCO198283 TaxID=2883505 RepID=UPI001E48FAF5|nr:hypothetical protein [Mycobacterium sp. MYCO198283]MCG5432531.1 hypothetical protein [Mycobacterium sp. MYCO198283]
MNDRKTTRQLTRNGFAVLAGLIAIGSFAGLYLSLGTAGERSQAWVDAVVREKCHPAHDIPAPDNHLLGWIALVLSFAFMISALSALVLLAERGRWWSTVVIATVALVLTPVIMFLMWASTETITQHIDMGHGIDGTGISCGGG